jgi:serine/threonine protein kinase
MKRARNINDVYVRKGSAKGQGVSSDVFCAERKEDKKQVAIKRLKEAAPAEARTQNLIPREVAIMGKLNHPNITTVLEIVSDKDNHTFIVMEWMQHDLRGLLCSNYSEFFSRAHVKGYAHQIVLGVGYCHHNNLMHLDLKPENILISSQGVVKISDFGLSEQYNPEAKRKRTVVSRWYRPLEVFYGEPVLHMSIDLWSLGCIIAELLLNHPILPGESDADQLACIYHLCGTPMQNDWPDAVSLPDYTPPPEVSIRNLDDKLRVKNKTSRAGYFTASAIALLDSLLMLDPKKRISAVDALKHDYFTEAPKPLEAFLMPRYKESFFGSVRRRK